MEQRTQKIAFEHTGNDTITNYGKANIVLVHGACADGSSWSKVIPILQNAGHKVIAVQLPLHSLADDVATVRRAIDLIGGPVVLVGHSYGGFVTTNAAYNNANVNCLAPKRSNSTAICLKNIILPSLSRLTHSTRFLLISSTSLSIDFGYWSLD
jgi:pimeloyl-ACP methyl ester carboxylesterase